MSRPTEDDEPIADAGYLIRDEPARRPPAPSTPSRKAADPGGYDLEGDDPPEFEPIPPTIPTPPPIPARAAGPRRPNAEPREALTEAPPARVEQVWSRWGEWWPTVIAQVAVMVAVLFLVYATLSVKDLMTPLVILALGAVGFCAVSYPMLITLERPTRMTPEQAVKDYLAALSHVFPHYRRMWLLLSANGRESPHFRTFPEFKAYWKAKRTELRAGKVEATALMTFKVADFQAEKSVGKTVINAKYTVNVAVEGRTPEVVLASVRIAAGLVKGPDAQWYLNEGALAGGPP